VHSVADYNGSFELKTELKAIIQRTLAFCISFNRSLNKRKSVNWNSLVTGMISLLHNQQ